MMKKFLDHYIKLQDCTLFLAPKKVIRPYTLPENCELIEIITGGTVFHPENSGHAYRRGTIFWHQSGEKTIWQSDLDDPYRCLVLSLVTDGSPRKFPRISKWKNIPELTVFTGDMLDFSRRGMLDDPLVFNYCMGILCRQMVKEVKLPRILQKACSILSCDPARNISVEELAKEVSLSGSRLFALFREYLHTSPHRYQMERRIEMAKSLLSTRQDIPVKEISAMCGFEHLELFYRRFKQHTGMTPVEYRSTSVI